MPVGVKFTEVLTQEPTGDRLRPWRSVKRVVTSQGTAGLGKLSTARAGRSRRRRGMRANAHGKWK